MNIYTQTNFAYHSDKATGAKQSGIKVILSPTKILFCEHDMQKSPFLPLWRSRITGYTS